MEQPQHPADQMLSQLSKDQARKILNQKPVAPSSFSVEYEDGEVSVKQVYDPSNHEDETEGSIKERLEDEIKNIKEQYEETDEFDISVDYEFSVTDEGEVELFIRQGVDDKGMALLAISNFVFTDLCYLRPEWALNFMHEKGQIASMRMLAKEKLETNDGGDVDYIN